MILYRRMFKHVKITFKTGFKRDLLGQSDVSETFIDGTLEENLSPLFFCTDDISMRINEDTDEISISSVEDTYCEDDSIKEEIRLFILEISYRDDLFKLLEQKGVKMTRDYESDFKLFYTNY